MPTTYQDSPAARTLEYALSPIWERTLGDADACIAVLDGPVDLSHPCFEGANVTSLPGVGLEASKDGPAVKHGTYVASIIFGQHGSPIKGIAPACRGIVLPIFSDGPQDSIAPCSQLDLARAITRATEEGAQIINISGGQLDSSGEPHELLAKAIRACADTGALIVASAGNDGCDCLHVPAAAPSVLAVGAMDSEGKPLDSSNWGSSYRNQGVLAQGENIRGALPGGDTVSMTGTSLATPIVSGVAALLVSLQLKHGQEPDPLAIRAAILGSAIGCDERPAPDCRRLLAGRLNVEGAISQLLKRESKMPNSSESHESTTAQVTEGAHNVSTTQSQPPPVRAPASEGSRPTASDPTERPIAPSDTPRLGGASASVRPASYGIVAPSTCSCGEQGCTGGCGGGSPQLVYALGQLGFDFGTEARRDSIMQQMEGGAADPAKLLDYLGDNPWEAESILWTLNLDATPLYAIQPSGPFAGEGYKRLREFLREQLADGVERVAVGGMVAGKAVLQSGQAVPGVRPELRCLNNWTTKALAQAASKDGKASAAEPDLAGFLERIYHELRNLGIAPEHRALNYAATNAFNAATVFREALKAKLAFDGISVERSPVCRPGSDCWDIKLRFFDPENVLRAKRIFRYTVDVSDVCPVAVGDVRSWSAR